MRKAINRKLIEMASNDRNIILLTADVGFKVFKEFREKFPEQYINVGIAESSMIGMAAGLALNKKKVFVYSIATFATMRCFEQIRVDLCYQNLPVTIIGGGAGLVYGTAGATHQAIEDIAVMSNLPNMTVIAPGDPIEVEYAIEKSTGLKGPCYIRIAKNGEKNVHENINCFEIGKAIEVYKGKKIALVTTGNMLNNATEVRKILLSKNIECGIISFHTIKPIDTGLIKELNVRYEVLVSIEEHIVDNGLGSKIANTIVDYDLSLKLIKFGIPDKFIDVCGEQAYLREYFGLMPKQIASRILNLIA